MELTQKGFSFVELIVVLVIIAILSTIGFVSYESYLSTGRDTVKISLLKDISTSFGTYSLKSRIPTPENKIDITASGSVFAYQGDFTEETAGIVGFKGDPYDEDLDIYPSYMLSLNRKDFQLLHFLEDAQSIQTSIPSAYAFTDYQQLTPKLVGKALGIMLDAESQEPIHILDTYSASGSYDVVNGTGSIRAYYSQNESFEDNISRVIPDKNCQRILDLGGSNGSGVYSINPTGTNKIRVYCDMETDGGGWNLVSNNDNSDDESAGSTDCKPRLSGFPGHTCGSVSESSDFVANAAGLEFNELIFSGYSGKFSNMNTYQYMKWDTTQVIPDTETFESDIASSWDNELITKKGINDLRCTSYDPRYVTLHNGLGSFEPHFAIQTDLAGSEREFSFIDDRNSGTTINAYGLDDYQDGDGCSDGWGNKAYRGSSAYIMIR